MRCGAAWRGRGTHDFVMRRLMVEEEKIGFANWEGDLLSRASRAGALWGKSADAVLAPCAKSDVAGVSHCASRPQPLQAFSRPT